jgi:hypothetical protein
VPDTVATPTEAGKATLNGWQRLWVLIAIAWALAVVSDIGERWYAVPDPDRRLAPQICRGVPDNPGDQTPRGRLIRLRVERAGRAERLAACYPRSAVVPTRATSWLVPVALIYAFGWGLGWVRRGFRSSQVRRPGA